MIRNPDAALMEIAEQIHMDTLGLFVTKVENSWTGAIVCQLSQTAFNPACVVINLYCKGPEAETRNELVKALYNFATEGGYNDVIAINTNYKPMAFDKVFSVLGEPTVLGSIFRFDLEESLL